jgi:SOS-response transcriptional repressor LexA
MDAKDRRCYVRTAAGQRAWKSPGSGLPAHYRQIISLIGAKTSREEICKGMGCHSTRQVQSWLDELQTLGFIEVKGKKKSRSAVASASKSASKSA